MRVLKITIFIILSLNFVGCVKEYPENRLYSDGLNHGRAYDMSVPQIEFEAAEFNKQRTQVLDDYFDDRAYEIFRDLEKNSFVEGKE